MATRDEVLAVNAAFYDAHERRDITAMTAVWAPADDAICVHPGWPILRGWPAIEQSWRQIFGGPGRTQFILTNETLVIRGDAAWITLEENLVDRGETHTIAATNVFHRGTNGWRLVAHHGSPVLVSR